MCFVLQLLNKSLYTIGANNQYSTNSPILHGSMKTPEKSLINDYTIEVHELDQTRTSTKRLHIMLDAQYENPD